MMEKEKKKRERDSRKTIFSSGVKLTAVSSDAVRNEICPHIVANVFPFLKGQKSPNCWGIVLFLGDS